MIEIKAKGATMLECVLNNTQVDFPFDCKTIWIGRGQQLIQKQAQCPQDRILNLAGLSQAVSRIHACLSFSPAFFYHPQTYPAFLSHIPSLHSLPNHIFMLIWLFVQSPRTIVLRDLQSKTGLFRKITTCNIAAGLQIVLGDSRPLVFHHQEIYDSPAQLGVRLHELTDQGYVLLNPGEGAVSFWVLSFKGCKLILLDRQGKVLIGRSSDCHLAIPEASISRKHAYLEYNSNCWRLGDGDGVHQSSNGVWVRTKRICIQHRKENIEIAEGEKVAKVGDVLLTFNIKEEHSFLGVEDKSTDQSFHQMLKHKLDWRDADDADSKVEDPPEHTQQTAIF